MTSEEIISKAESTILQVCKKANTSKDKEIAGVFDLYKDTCELYERIEVHAVRGEFPKKLFENRSPNQTEKEAKYIEKNYKQYTLPEFMDYINTICRPFGDGNWSISYNEDSSVYKESGQTFQKYVESELPIYYSLEEFVKSVLPTIKTIDANGFTAVRPKEIDYTLDDSNTFVVDSTSLYRPTVFYYESENVIDYKEGEYYLFLSAEKSVVTTTGGKKKEGNIFELYTKDEVYFFKQEGLKSENNFVQELFYKHNLGVIPVRQMKGIPQLKDDSILWQSPFIFGVDLLDLVAVNSNFLQFSVNKCVFPMTVMYGDVCTFTDSHGAVCSDGNLIGVSDNGAYNITCPSCSGSGIKGRISPFGTLLIKPTTLSKEGETNSSQPPLSFVSPDVTTLEFLEKKIDKDTIKARQILKLRNRNSIVNGQPITATEVFDDSKGMTAFIKPIIDQIFSLYEFYLTMIGKQRYSDSFMGFELVYPKSYDFKNAEDYLNDLTNAIKNSLPPAYIQSLLMQYINAYYGDNEMTTKIYKLVMRADRIFALTQDEINMKMAKGTVDKWEDILHSSVLNFISDAIAADDKFLDKEVPEQIKVVQDMAKAKAAEITDTNLAIYQTPNSVGGGGDFIGKIPLSLQQLALARARATESNDKGLANQIGDKMDELLKKI